MAFRTQSTPAQGLHTVKSQAIGIRNYSIAQRDLMAAQNISANALRQTMSTFKTFIELLTASAAIPGIVQYARDQENDQTYNVVTEFQTMETAAIAVRNRIINDVPKGPTGEVAVETWEADGAITVEAFTPAQTANLRTDLDTFIASIEI